LRVDATEYAFASDATIRAGRVLLTLTDDGQEPHHLQLWRLAAGTTIDDYKSMLKKESHDDTMAPVTAFAGGVGTVGPGESAQAIVDLRPGTYVLVCRIANPDRHLYQGMVQGLTVTDAPSSASDWAPVPDGTVTFADKAFTLPGNVTAGHHVWIFENHGPGPRAFEVRSASGDYRGGAEVIDEGASELVVLDLGPGEYRATSSWVAPDPTWTDFKVS
jgi:hypothetical protein